MIIIPPVMLNEEDVKKMLEKESSMPNWFVVFLGLCAITGAIFFLRIIWGI